MSVYEVPQRYVTQICLELKAWECSEAWLLVGTKESVTAFRCYEDERLLTCILNTASELYSPVKPSVPTRLHSSVHILRNELKAYINTHTAFFLECPSKTGEFGNLLVGKEVLSAYAVTPHMDYCEVVHKDIDYQSAMVSSETKRFFNCSHTVLRNQALEVVVFMATNKDRVQKDGMPYSFPVAYALKGSSMSNEDLRFMTNCVRDEFRKRSIPILSEVYDGQWHQYITTDAESRSLTKLGWRHKWQEILNYSKAKCIALMEDGCRMRPADSQLLSSSARLEDKENCKWGNISISCALVCEKDGEELENVRKILTVSSTGGGGTFKYPVVGSFITVCKHSRPDLFEGERNFSTCHAYADPIGMARLPMVMPEKEAEIVNDHNYCKEEKSEGKNGQERRRRKSLV